MLSPQNRPRATLATVLLASGLLLTTAGLAAGPNQRRTPGSGPNSAPVQPVITEPAPPGRHRLPFGEASVTPTTIVSGAPDQTIRVTLRLTRAVEADELLVRLYRPRLESSPSRGRGFGAVSVAARSVSVRGARAGSERALTISGLNPPPGRYRLDLLTRSGRAPARLAARAAVVVYGQHRLPPRETSDVGSQQRSEAPGDSRALTGDELNHNVSSLTGDQAETFAAVRPNDPSRVIAASNPGATGNPKAWISNNFLRPTTTVMATLPSSTLMPADEGGGTASLDLCCDPALAADRLGNLWYSVLSTDPNSHIVVNRVAAGTTTFQANNTAIPRFTTGEQDKNMMTIDNTPTSPKFGMLYVVWNENPGQNTVISQCNTRPGGVSNAANCDNPNNWTEPARVTDVAGSYIYASVAAAPGGDVYVAWWDYSGDNDVEIDRCLAASNCASAASWGADTDVDNLDASGGTALPFFCPIISAPGGRVGTQPYVDVGPDGRVYVASSDLRANGTTKCSGLPTDQTFDSFIARGPSPNTFPAANSGVRLSDDAATAANDHFFPSLTVDQSTGEVQSNLYSTKLDGTGQTTHQFYVRSTDGGAFYSAMQQITTLPSNFSGLNSDGFDYGDYEGADSAGGRMFPVWSDNREGDTELFSHTLPAPTPGDVTPPNTNITGGPSGTTNDNTPTFNFSSSEAGSTFECRIDAGAFVPCTPPFTTGGLADGTHTFAVRATDPAGNIGSPASRGFTVDATPPDTRIDSGPSGTTNDNTPTFTFSSTEAGSTFQCQLDGGASAACSSPFTTGALPDGAHTFAVRATDPVGNADPTPASVAFSVATTAPIVPSPTPIVTPTPSLPTPLPARCLRRTATLLGTALGNRLVGTGARDVIVGLGGNDRVSGLGGSDRVCGGAGNDRLSGGSGNDILSGDRGNDSLNGGRGNDRLSGGTGNDRLTGGPGRNSYSAGGGNDRINAANRRRERVNCGKGRDRVTADRSDRLIGCERVRRPSRG